MAFSPGGFAVERVLAQGPNGRVYVARAPDGAQVALKELQFASVPGAQQIDAFEREAKTLKTLRHLHIPRFVASFPDGEGVNLRLYLASELIAGEPLSARIAEHRFGESELRDVAEQVLQVLVYLHGRAEPVLHRDIKPDNLVLRPEGSIVLVDFGSARKLSGPRTYNSTLAGTFGYMPTEQLGGTVDATSDLYALGATLLHAATGKPPSDLLTPDMTLRVPDSVPPALRPFLSRLVQPRRDRRFSSAQEALDALENGLPAPRRQRRLALLLVAATGLFFALRTRTLDRAATRVVDATVAPAPAVRTSGAIWFARAKPSCNPVEVAQLIARSPPPAGLEGAAYGAACWALAGKIVQARSLLATVPPDSRWKAAGIVFDVAHPVADAGDDLAAGPIMNLVLESWPNHYQALYHAGMSDSALGNQDRAREHLNAFLRLYHEDDFFTRSAKAALAKL